MCSIITNEFESSNCFSEENTSKEDLNWILNVPGRTIGIIPMNKVFMKKLLESEKGGVFAQRFINIFIEHLNQEFLEINLPSLTNKIKITTEEEHLKTSSGNLTQDVRVEDIECDYYIEFQIQTRKETNI